MPNVIKPRIYFQFPLLFFMYGYTVKWPNTCVLIQKQPINTSKQNTKNFMHWLNSHAIVTKFAQYQLTPVFFLR